MNRFTTKSLIIFFIILIICFCSIKKHKIQYILFYIIMFFIIFKILINNYKKNISKKLVKYITKLDKNKINIHRYTGNFPMYYINLDRAYTRNNYMMEQKTKYNLNNLLRVEGVDCKNLKSIFEDKYIFKNGDILNYKINYYKSHKINELGCLLSHLYTIYKAYHNGDNFAYIMEDDVYFGLVSTWDKTIYQFLENAPTDWNLLQLYSMNSNVLTNSNTFRKRKVDDWSTCIYFINRKAMHYIVSTLFINGNLVINKHPKIDVIFGVGNPLNADYFLYNYIEHGIGGVYATKPLFISNDLYTSYINNKDTEHIENALHILNKLGIN